MSARARTRTSKPRTTERRPSDGLHAAVEQNYRNCQASISTSPGSTSSDFSLVISSRPPSFIPGSFQPRFGRPQRSPACSPHPACRNCVSDLLDDGMCGQSPSPLRVLGLVRPWKCTSTLLTQAAFEDWTSEDAWGPQRPRGFGGGVGRAQVGALWEQKSMQLL